MPGASSQFPDRPGLDTLSRVLTPEGCELELRLAGPVVRARAWLIDTFLRVLLFAGVASLLGYFGHFGWAAAILLAFLLEWLYPVFFEVLWQGATPGKRWSGLTVLHDDGTPVGWGASFARNTLRAVDFMPTAYACGLLTMWLNPHGKRLGDVLAGTVVVYRERPVPPVIGDDYREEETPPFPLSETEQRALIEYRLRAGALTEARAAELAELALPLTEGLRPEAGQARLFRIANQLLGRGTLEDQREIDPARDKPRSSGRAG
ncbi:MAG: RDD family protein [Candidatus Accumulibacter sp.]|jgi:uncharacterized RDD family membrane protein YckC|nr:RDD family protein [Accumulibacter sp.]